jgi:hypothetical protein
MKWSTIIINSISDVLAFVIRIMITTQPTKDASLPIDM